ncbi:YndM family protein [Bacillus sp. Marseille-Q3570]|uniref:YndM family protein n=1 Tax=Bacillus sp. Marseille-Q3570 TaxID=2963522 RepID=UPI0021B7DE9B|nr:YndM family protein [Bacillus sp. Marseille-Q3570]
MDHVKALAIKAGMTLPLLYLILGLGFGISIMNVVILTVVLGGVSYILGDLVILPKFTNMKATMTDIGLTFIVIWLVGIVLTGLQAGTMAVAAAITASVIALGEHFFHFYILRKELGATKHLKAQHTH